jgi:2-polyprenyl-6-methoxyphenol hydroxylase-like FAD-dependent oxidoreductase
MPKAAAGAERPMMDGGDGYIAEIEIPRGDLSRVLHDDTRDGVEYVFGDRIAALTQDADGVTATSQAQKRLLRDRMAGLGWLTRRILTHLDDTPDFYLDQVAQVVMDRWSIGRVGLLGDAAFSSSPMSGAGTGLALVGAYLLAGELATAGWDPEAGFAGYERRMRSYVEATQEIGRLHVRSRDVPGPDIDFHSEWFTELVERALNGVELPDYTGVPDLGTPAGPPITPSAEPKVSHNGRRGTTLR